MILEKILEERIRFRYEKAEHEYIQIVSEWFAYVILTRCRKIVDHKYDPPWDCSGNIINTDGKFSLDDYPALLDFVENEYSGNSRPSFISGCGIFYNTYSDELDDITRDWIVYQLEYIIKELIEEENVQLKDWLLTLDEIINFDIENTLDISQEILCEDIISDFTFSEFPYEIMESILCMDPKLLFKRGKDTAMQKIQEERLQQEEGIKKAKENCRKAKELWAKVVKRYEIRFGEKIAISKIEKPLYDNKLKLVLIGLRNEGIRNEEIQNIGKSLGFKFSNSVRDLISEFS